MRDYNDMICGICGIAPKVEIAQRDRKYALELKNVEVTEREYDFATNLAALERSMSLFIS